MGDWCIFFDTSIEIFRRISTLQNGINNTRQIDLVKILRDLTLLLDRDFLMGDPYMPSASPARHKAHLAGHRYFKITNSLKNRQAIIAQRLTLFSCAVFGVPGFIGLQRNLRISSREG